MNFGQMQTELGYIIKDSHLAPLLAGWINDAILEIAMDYDLPPLKLAEPYSLSVVDTDWLWTLPESFHKKLFRARYVDATSGDEFGVSVHKNSDYIVGQDHTDTGDVPTMVTVIPQGNTFSLGCYPLSTVEMHLWFYEKPTVLVNDSDECDCIPANFVPGVIYPKLIIKNYHFILDQVIDFPMTQGPLQYWRDMLKIGIQGAPGHGVGLLNYFNMNYHPPRRTGGRDPIGARPY